MVDVDRRGRHLLLLVRDGGEKSKFLCGHDERHWFVAAVPEDARGVAGVATAKVALQPEDVRAAVDRQRPKDQFRRRNAAFPSRARVRCSTSCSSTEARTLEAAGVRSFRDRLTAGRHALNVEIEVRSLVPELAGE